MFLGFAGRGTVEKSQDFWALRDVSITVQPGEALGLIGPNGAGKTTILRLVAGITVPTQGSVTVRGRVGALIALGAGFHADLTGRENVYLNAAILGLSRREIDERYDAIVDFAGLEPFMDTPVKRYSSGMYARLGYSVAAHVDPDILLVDEVLAVGDATFQAKCMRHMDAVRRSGKTVILVTHSLYRIEALCDRALWLEHGVVRCFGTAADVVRAYLDAQEETTLRAEAEADSMVYHAEYPVHIDRVELLDAACRPTEKFAFHSPLTVRIFYTARQAVDRPLFNLRIVSHGTEILEASMLIDGYGPDVIHGAGMVECALEALPLTPKVYDIMLFARSGDGVADIIRMDTYARFRVTEEGLASVPMNGPMALNHLRQGSPVYVRRSWRFEPDEVDTATFVADTASLDL